MKKNVKVVYNGCYGGFSLSPEAVIMLNELKNYTKENENYINPDYGFTNLPRHDPDLIEVVETLKEKANGNYTKLNITEVNGKYIIEEYDGYESVIEPLDIDWITP